MSIVQLALLVWLGINLTLLVLFGVAILRVLIELVWARQRLSLMRVLRP